MEKQFNNKLEELDFQLLQCLVEINNITNEIRKEMDSAWSSLFRITNGYDSIEDGVEVISNTVHKYLLERKLDEIKKEQK